MATNTGTDEKLLSNFMLISIFIDEWNVFSVTMLSIFLSSYFHFTTIDIKTIYGKLNLFYSISNSL